MKKFYPVGSINDLRPGKGMKVKIKNRTIALFKHKNKVYAIQNSCPHQNADLADGYIKDHGGKIIKFDEVTIEVLRPDAHHAH